jgi:hypothetical protein
MSMYDRDLYTLIINLGEYLEYGDISEYEDNPGDIS